MKKAKDYASEILDKYVLLNEKAALNQAALSIKELFNEAIELQKVRKITQYKPMLAILKEQHVKWMAICNRVNKEVPLLNARALLQIIEEKMTMIVPNLYKKYPELTRVGNPHFVNA